METEAHPDEAQDQDKVDLEQARRISVMIDRSVGDLDQALRVGRLLDRPPPKESGKCDANASNR
jgi:hypothetical protein